MKVTGSLQQCCYWMIVLLSATIASCIETITRMTLLTSTVTDRDRNFTESHYQPSCSLDLILHDFQMIEAPYNL